MTKPAILQTRQALRPYQYPQFMGALEAVQRTPWSHHKISMSADILDWKKISPRERKVIGGILRTFTLLEATVGCYWRTVVASSFNLPEIIMMATAFAYDEVNHAIAYDHLDATLGIDSYAAFQQDEIACQKVGDIIGKLDSTEDLAFSLACFSAFVEGVSLFSSFAILLSFAKENQFKGMAAILSYSVGDEMLHSKMGIELYKQLIKESPELKPEESKIQAVCDLIVQNEIAFIENVFEGNDLDSIKESECIDFVKYRANLKLMELRIPPLYDLTGDYKEVKHFFDTLTKGTSMTDFFVSNNNGTAYTGTISQDFLNV